MMERATVKAGGKDNWGELNGVSLASNQIPIYWFQNPVGLRRPEVARPVWQYDLKRWRTHFIELFTEFRPEIIATLEAPLDPSEPVLQAGDDWRTPIGVFFFNYSLKINPCPCPIYVDLRRSFRHGVMRQICPQCLRPSRKRHNDCHEGMPETEPLNQELINYGWAFTNLAYDSEREIMLETMWNRLKEPVVPVDFDPWMDLTEVVVTADKHDPKRGAGVLRLWKEKEDEIAALKAQLSLLTADPA